MHHGLEDNSGRIFNCARCHRQRIICRSCDRGNRYCSEECAETARRESLKRARLRFQKSSEGRALHCAAQKRHRQRKASSDFEKSGPADRNQTENSALPEPVNISTGCTKEISIPSVMDHGSPAGRNHGIVMAMAAKRRLKQAREQDQEKQQVRCDMCGACCGPFLRRKPWHRGRRVTHNQGGHP